MSVPSNTVKVRFQGIELWLLSKEGRGRALAPLEHCDENGELITLGVSFAHVYDEGHISRFGQRIGSIEDLEVIP